MSLKKLINWLDEIVSDLMSVQEKLESELEDSDESQQSDIDKHMGNLSVAIIYLNDIASFIENFIR